MIQKIRPIIILLYYNFLHAKLGNVNNFLIWSCIHSQGSYLYI